MPENEGTDTSSHDAGTRKGEEMKKSDGKESGRHDEGETGAGRPTGSSTARDSTGINAEKEDPIDPSSPKLPPA
ncbi:MAG: hypothetical protein ABJA66_04840 [Actinomycetota bacterium]